MRPDINQKDTDNRIYKAAYNYLLGFEKKGVTADVINKYLHFSETKPRQTRINGIYSRLLESAQNGSMKSKVIGDSIDGFKNIGKIVFDFDPATVVSKYPDPETILDKVISVLKPRGEIRKEKNSIWPLYCKTILSAANFLSRFKSASDFYIWSDFFDKDERARAALPLIISQEVDGIGYALACDFLKELGYVKFGKPDVHIKYIFRQLDLCDRKATDYQIQKSITRIANNVGVSPYNADKLFWLVGSGNFYDNPEIGNNGRVSGINRQDFINLVLGKK